MQNLKVLAEQPQLSATQFDGAEIPQFITPMPADEAWKKELEHLNCKERQIWMSSIGGTGSRGGSVGRG